MTQDEFIAKAVEALRRTERAFERHADKIGADVRLLKVDQMPKRTIRDAVFITFEADDDRGRIEVVMDSKTGEMLDNKFIPPNKPSDESSAP